MSATPIKAGRTQCAVVKGGIESGAGALAPGRVREQVRRVVDRPCSDILIATLYRDIGDTNDRCTCSRNPSTRERPPLNSMPPTTEAHCVRPALIGVADTCYCSRCRRADIALAGDVDLTCCSGRRGPANKRLEHDER